MAAPGVTTIRLDHSPLLTPNNLSAVAASGSVYFTYLHDNIACITVSDATLGDGATRNFTVASAGHGSPNTIVTQAKWLTINGKPVLVVLSSAAIQFFSLTGVALLSHPLSSEVLTRGACLQGQHACIGLSTGGVLRFRFDRDAPVPDGEIAGPTSPVSDLAGNDAVLVSGHEDGLVCVREPGRQRFSLAATGIPVSSLLIVGDHLFVGLASGAIDVHTLAKGVKVAAIDAHARPLTALVEHSGMVLSASEDSRVCAWSLEGGRVKLHRTAAVPDAMLAGAASVGGALVLAAYDVPRLTVMRL